MPVIGIRAHFIVLWRVKNTATAITIIFIVLLQY